jgi:hypothetical protein
MIAVPGGFTLLPSRLLGKLLWGTWKLIYFADAEAKDTAAVFLNEHRFT